MSVWKKAAKCNRISKLVSDHIHSPHKRGGSLVVETGFPTSLVDLFVKNRDRLRKPSTKKKKKFEAVPDAITTPTCLSPSSCTLASSFGSGWPNSPLVSPISENSGLGLPSVCILASENVNLASSDRFGYETDEIQEKGLVGDCEDAGGDGGEVVASKRVFVAIFKTFLVVVFALGTKKFVVGITMSAFLLLFMEYAGKHFGWLIKPCLGAQKFLADRLFRNFGIAGGKLVVKEDRGVKAPVSDCFLLIEGSMINDSFHDMQIVRSNSNFGGSWGIKGHKMNDPFQEIQIEEPSPDLVPSTREIQSVKYEFDLLSGKDKWVHEVTGKKEEVTEKAEACTYDVVDLKSHRTRSSKIRSKIKKLVSDKLYRSKKKRMASKNEASSASGDNVVVFMGEAKEHLEEDEQGSGLEYVNDGKSSSFSSLVTSCSSSELSRAVMEDTVMREDFGTNSQRNSGYVVVIVIVLVGLAWGRGLALVFTLSWYLLLKSAAGTEVQK